MKPVEITAGDAKSELSLQQLVGGAASGYIAKAFQIASGLVVLPFLLRDDVLGLSAFGVMSSILVVSSLLALLLDGARLSFVRGTARSIACRDEGGRDVVGKTIGDGFVTLAGVAAVLALAVVGAGPWLLRWLGLALTWDTQLALSFAIACFWLEAAMEPFRAPLLARGLVGVTNWVVAIEVALRTIIILVVFSSIQASIGLFFMIQCVTTFGRGAFFVMYLGVRLRGDLRGFTKASWSFTLDRIKFSVATGLFASVQNVVVRFPILVATRVLGSDFGGLVAIILDTLRRYILQVGLSVVQPVVMPLATRLDPRRLPKARKAMFARVESLVAIAAGLMFVPAMIAAEWWLAAWLGSDFVSLVWPARLLVGACLVEVAYLIRRSVLIGSGLVSEATAAVVTCTLGTVLVTCALGFLGASWGALVLPGIAVVFVINIGVVDKLYRSEVCKPYGMDRRPLLAVYLTTTILLALILSAWVGPNFNLPLVGVVLIGVVTNLLASHLLLQPASESLETIAMLVRSRQTNLFYG